ncbi:MAG: hypothetical protein GXP61_00280 [Epsilonproteobacteria bacterium]|nr:hypothetical protein [Campylobacterota bacterium]
MLILLPLVLIIVVIAAINHIYYSDINPAHVDKSKHIEKNIKNQDAAKKYLDKYIKQ